MSKIIENIQRVILSVFIFIFPLFFLSTTPEYYTTNKFYLLILTALLLLSLSTISIFITKKFEWKKSNFDGPALLAFLTLLISLVIVSPNKIAALLNPTFGPLSIFFLVVIFYFSSYLLNPKKIFSLLNASILIIAILSLISIFEPLKNINLPSYLAYIKSPYFSPIGGRVDLLIIVSFMLVYWISKIYVAIKNEKASINKLWYPYLFLLIYLITTGAGIFSIVKPITERFAFVLPTFKDSWFASIEILKNVLTALFGVGVDNFSSVFSQAKDVSYNQSNLWTQNTINFSRSAILHIITTVGVFGFLGFCSLIFTSLKDIKIIEKSEKQIIYPVFLFILLTLLYSPPTLLLFFLFFIILSFINHENLKRKENEKSSFDLENLAPLYFGLILVLIIFIVASFYFLGRNYLSQFYSNQSVNNLNDGKLSDAYANQRKAIVLNPYTENQRITFSQINILVANTVIQNAQKRAIEKSEQQINLTDNEKLQVSQAIQQSIAEAKAAITLNPQKASYWANLASIYTNLINVTQGSDVWAISSYQRAINLDPKSPLFRFDLGSVYYTLKKYSDATNLFRQTVTLKSDWPNAHYNLAWSLYNQQNYQEAANEMQTVLTLLKDNKNSEDYKTAEKNLEDFKKQVEATQAQQEVQKGEQLNLPQTPQPQLSPKIELPKSASPEAK